MFSRVIQKILFLFTCTGILYIWKWKWHTTKYCDPYSEIVLCIYPILSAHTQQWTHIHREHTPGAVGSHLCCGARGAVEGSVLKGTSVVVLKVEESCCTFTPPTYNSCRPEIRTHNLSITSPTLSPLGHDFPSTLIYNIVSNDGNYGEICKLDSWSNCKYCW